MEQYIPSVICNRSLTHKEHIIVEVCIVYVPWSVYESFLNGDEFQIVVRAVTKREILLAESSNGWHNKKDYNIYFYQKNVSCN